VALHVLCDNAILESIDIKLIRIYTIRPLNYTIRPLEETVPFTQIVIPLEQYMHI
jgi:hypothetical protein